MCVLSELNSIDPRNWRRFHWMIAHSGQISLGAISVYGSISSWWKYSGGEASFIVAAVILTSAAACGVVGLILRNDAPSHAPLRQPSRRAVHPTHSSVPGASNATAS